MVEQEIVGKYKELLKYLKRKNFELSETDPKGRKSNAIPKLIEYLKVINKNQKLPLKDKEFVVNKFIVLRDFDRKKYDDFITILNKIDFPEYYDQNLLSTLVDEIVVMNKKRDLLQFYKNIYAQISKKFNIDPAMLQETTKDFINRYLIKEGYMSAQDDEYTGSKFSQIVINYEEGKEKEYIELVKTLADIIAKESKLEEPIIVPRRVIPKSIRKAQKKFGKYVSKKFTEVMTGKKISDDYKPQEFYGPPATKRIYRKLESGNIPNVLGDKTVKVRGVRDLGKEPTDLNIHIFNNYEAYRNTLDCLANTKFYCFSFVKNNEEEKVIPCILDSWVDEIEIQKSKLFPILSSSYYAPHRRLPQTEKYVARDFKNGYIVTRDFSNYTKLSNIYSSLDFKEKEDLKIHVEELLTLLFQSKILHGDIHDENIMDNILIDPNTKNIVLTHFEKCNPKAKEEDLNSERNVFKKKNLVDQTFDPNPKEEKRKRNEGKEEDISELKNPINK
jgi:hypothetical protein